MAREDEKAFLFERRSLFPNAKVFRTGNLDCIPTCNFFYPRLWLCAGQRHHNNDKNKNKTNLTRQSTPVRQGSRCGSRRHAGHALETKGRTDRSGRKLCAGTRNREHQRRRIARFTTQFQRRRPANATRARAPHAQPAYPRTTLPNEPSGLTLRDHRDELSSRSC